MQMSPWLLLPVAVVSTSAYATTYLSVEQAQQAMYPGVKLTEAFLTVTAEQQRQIEQLAGTPMPRREIRLWRAPAGGVFIVDDVVGKHEFITYALALDADGSIRQIEILDYRESYGWEIRNANWRRQFVGKTPADPVRLDKDIRNISGATMSCRHVTEGVKRLLAAYAVALK
jgi:hypothetical protein